MEWADVAILVLVFGVLLGLGVPIGYCIGAATVATMAWSIPVLPALTTEAQRISTGLDSFALLAIPFFVLAGQIMNRGGIARRLIDLARALLGMLPGGLAHVNILAAMLFGAISGSAVAAATAVGGVMGPEMEKEGYEREFGAAVNITSATTGLLIPPSNILIVYSLASGGVSIAALFLAGYIPGILVGLSLMVVAGILAVRRGYRIAGKVPARETARRFIDAIPSLFLLIVVIGGIVAGFFTATEAAAVAVLYALILAFLYREISVNDLPQILLDSALTTAVVLLLVATSMGLSWIMAYTNIPQNLTAGLVALTESKVLILLILNALLLAVGTFMDMTPAVLIFTPIILPIAANLGIDPTHLGIIMVLNLCIGLCTPPVGSVLFIGTEVAGTSIARLVRPLLPLYLAMVFALMVVTYVPELSMWLPRAFGF
jgi:tripartite ATP-independent transporter DctM subunit